MKDICTKIVDGDHNPPKGQTIPTKYIMISSKNINNHSLCSLDEVRYLSAEQFCEADGRTKATPGDIFMTSVASLGRTVIYDGSLNISFQRSVTVISTLVSNRYLQLFIDSPLYQKYIDTNAKGTAQRGFYLNQVEDSWVPIPPYAEQEKIYDSAYPLLNIVDEIEGLGDKLKGDIDKVKGKVLALAISGKLVSQDPSDEPAIELLKRINPDFKPCDNSHYPFEIPENWELCHLGELFIHNTGKALNASNKDGVLMRYITTSNLYWDRFELSEAREMLFIESEIDKCQVIKGDLLVCEGGDVGRSAIWPYDDSIMIQNHIHKLRPKGVINVRFYLYALMVYKQIGLIGGKGIGILGLSSRELDKLIIPVPPIEEQHRITEYVDGLFSRISYILGNIN